MEPLDDDHNLLWWHNFTVPANGSIRGNGANDGDILTSGPKAVKSVIISNFADKSKQGWGIMPRVFQQEVLAVS
jgi:hypothetical protein